MSIFSSLLFTVVLGGFFIYMFLFVYDFFYGEKKEKQIKKIHKYFRKETIKKIDLMEHEPKQFTRYNVVTSNGIQKIKMKPGYKVVKIVAKKRIQRKPQSGNCLIRNSLKEKNNLSEWIRCFFHFDK